MQVIPRISIVPTIGKVGSMVTVTGHGFGAGETVRFSFYKTPNVGIVMASAVADKYGRAEATFAIPASTVSGHKIAGKGASSGLSASRTFTVQPSLLLSPSSGKPGATIQVSLRGFQAGETVDIKLEGRSGPVKQIEVSSSGSAIASSSTAFKIPTSYDPGDYQVTATGQSSHVNAFRTLSVLLPTGATAPSPTPTTTVSPTESATEVASPEETVVATETATEAPTDVPTDTPTAAPTETETATPTDTPTETETPTETPAETATPSPTVTPT
jgi:hypothetical protein